MLHPDPMLLEVIPRADCAENFVLSSSSCSKDGEDQLFSVFFSLSSFYFSYLCESANYASVANGMQTDPF